MPTKVDDLITHVGTTVTNKTTRNFIFLLISIIAILAINSLLPIITGGSHYTEAPEDFTYQQYKELVEDNKNYTLTWKSKKAIEQYKKDYRAEHPDVPTEEFVLIEPPAEFTVTLYTKFFFQHIYWWLATLVHVISVLLIYYSIFNYILFSRKQNDKKYNDLVAEVDAAVSNSLDPVTFEPWLAEFNMKRKRKQHIANIRARLERLERWTRYRTKKATDPENKYHKNYLKYITKKNKLELFLTDEYIEKYVPNMKVKKFKYIYPNFVTVGYNSIGKTVDNYSLIKSDTGKITDDGLRKALSTFLITTIFAVVITFTVTASIDSPWYTILINVLVKLVPLLIQIPMAFDYCEAFMKDQLINNLMSRRSIALLYLAAMHTEVKENATEEVAGD